MEEQVEEQAEEKGALKMDARSPIRQMDARSPIRQMVERSPKRQWNPEMCCQASGNSRPFDNKKKNKTKSSKRLGEWPRGACLAPRAHEAH